jgi:hypothetical protein
VKLRGRPGAPERRRRRRRAARCDHLRARTTMSAAIMTMNRATTAADLISYSETLAAPRRWPFTVPSTDCYRTPQPAYRARAGASTQRAEGTELASGKTPPAARTRKREAPSEGSSAPDSSSSCLSRLALVADSNGEVEGPPRSAHQAPRAHTVSPCPRRVTSHRSRTPPTIVRQQRQFHGAKILLAATFALARPSLVNKMDFAFPFGSSMRPRSKSRFVASQSIPFQANVAPSRSKAVR